MKYPKIKKQTGSDDLVRITPRVPVVTQDLWDRFWGVCHSQQIQAQDAITAAITLWVDSQIANGATITPPDKLWQ